MLPHLALLVALQAPQGLATGFTSPPSGDTVGYWQQRVRYRISARLDEPAQVLRAAGELVYVNRSPDTLHEMFVHQYLNAFRPGSRWSADDAREGRVRFQRLRDPDYGYERFTAPVTVDGRPVRVDYPGAPDSTVAHFALPRPLAPGDSVAVHFEWDARPSTLPRRQGRRGRRYDFAQWFPKVAVYDRGGWEHNALRPAGEFYGEFGDYDVTLTVAPDQVIGATGVPVAGDPGWERARKWGEVHYQRDAYGPQPGMLVMTGEADSTAPGTKTVRFVARDVHHFAWSTSPQYRYEGSLYDGRIAVHVLYQPGDEAEWGNGKAVERTERALRWLESIYGRYAYPQMTNLHRIEGGGTEFPMVVMNGSAGQGLILHEGGHIFTYGILANNEWRSGWMDEGLTSYQTSWAQRVTPQEQLGDTVPGVAYVVDRPPAPAAPAAPAARGYAGNAVRPRPFDFSDLEQFRLDLVGRAEPIGTVAHEFRDFGVYNSMIYTRAEMMYGQLRDALGDTAFPAFMRLYYDRWRLKHVDERAMRKAAEDASGRDLGWFFSQWVHRTGLIDYALTSVRTSREGSQWLTRARVVRRGEYRHPMPVGARVGDEWVLARADPMRDRQWVEIRTAEPPGEVRLDPYRTTVDWDARNDVRPRFLVDSRVERFVFDWPFLNQWERDREVVALTPFGWYTTPGGATLGVRWRSNYQGVADRDEVGVALATRAPGGAPLRFGDVFRSTGNESGRLQFWYAFENPRFGRRPAMGWRFGGWLLDGGVKLEVRRRWDASPFTYARGPSVSWTAALDATAAPDDAWIDRARWEPRTAVVDLGLQYERRGSGMWRPALRARVLGGFAHFDETFVDVRTDWFSRAEAEASARRVFGARLSLAARGFAGLSGNAPLQRSLGISSRDATETFENHLLRGLGAPLARPDVHYVDLGDGGLRGYSPLLRVRDIAAVNLEAGYLLVRPPATVRRPELAVVGFADAATTGRGGPTRLPTSPFVTTARLLADAGVGLALRGPFFDRTVRVRLDFPLYVRDPAAAVGAEAGDGRAKLRWMFSFRDLW